MDTHSYGTVAALEFHTRPQMDFADIVEEFDIAFQLVDVTTRRLTWDCDNIATIDRDCLRVSLGWLPPSEPGNSWYLVVTVGPTPDGLRRSISMESLEYLADRIIERTSEHLPPDAVMTGDAGRPVNAKLVATVLSLLRQTSSVNRDDSYRTESGADNRPARNATIQKIEADVAAAIPEPAAIEELMNATAHPSMADAPCGMAPSLPAATTNPMRLSIHTLAITLMIQVPALGAFLFVYTMLRDMHSLAA